MASRLTPCAVVGGGGGGADALLQSVLIYIIGFVQCANLGENVP